MFGTFWENKLFHFFIFVDFRHKSWISRNFSFILPPHTIFQTKHVGMIPTIQMFSLNDFRHQKVYFMILVHRRHITEPVLLGVGRKKNANLINYVIKSHNTQMIYLIFIPSYSPSKIDVFFIYAKRFSSTKIAFATKTILIPQKDNICVKRRDEVQTFYLRLR